MSQQTVGELVYKITGEIEGLKKAVADGKKEMDGLTKKVEDVDKAGQKSGKTFSGLGKIFTALGGAIAIRSIINYSREAVASASALIEQQTKLGQTLRVSRNATDEQIQSLLNQANALEKVGVVNKEVILSAQAQVATFDLSADAIERLTPSLLNFIVAEKGASVSMEEAKASAQGLGQAIQGNFASLTRQGFVLDENTKKLISTGTEMERVEALVSVLDSTYDGLNEQLAGTFLGTQIRVSRAFGDLQEDIGFALMPALNVLGTEILGLNGKVVSGEERINALGKTFYRVAQGLIVVGRILQISFRTILGAIQGLVLGVAQRIERVLVVANNATEALGLSSEKLKNGLELTQNFIADLENRMGENLTGMEENADSLSNALSEMLNPKEFEPATQSAIQAYDQFREAQDMLGGSVADTSKEIEKQEQELEKLEGKFSDLIKKARETARTLEDDLSKAFRKFNEDLQSGLEAGTDSLAKVVVQAEEEIASLREKLRKDNIDPDNRIEIEREIKKQEEILKLQAGFEERRQKKLAEIRERLEDAGIDTSGISALTEVKTLEDQVAEQRRLNALNEFERLEEEQFKKLDLLAQTFIAEATLLREKIEQQKEYEAELTAFLNSENIKRTESVDEFANNAIKKYGEMASQLRSVISLQNQIADARQGFSAGGYVKGGGGQVHAGEYVIPAHMVASMGSLVSSLEKRRTGQTVNNNNTINAPINVQAVMNDEMDFRALSRELVWELGNK